MNFVDEFQLIDTNQVKTHGWEYWAFQGSEEHYGYFDAEMLTWTDDELRKYVDQVKKEKEEEHARKEIEKTRMNEEAERSLWEKLNEKFINEAENRYAIVAQGGIPEDIEKIEIDKSLIPMVVWTYHKTGQRKSSSKWYNCGEKERAKKRSKTFEGIAKAMAALASASANVW